MAVDQVLTRLDDQAQARLDRLIDFLKIPSISTDPAYHQDCLAAAHWLCSDLAGMGFTAEVMPTDGKPMVVASYACDRPDAPHYLFYGHYDVQPPDPLELWESPPFQPVIREISPGRKQIVARGAGDDKGQLMTFVEACRAWFAETGGLPCGITCLFEGEEESGSPSLEPFLAAHGNLLKGEVALVCDTPMWDRDTPAICFMLRGLVGEQVTIKAASRDLHSGLYGNAARNANQVLVSILAALRDEKGACAVPGFYDGVEDLPADIKAQWDGLDFKPDQFLGDVGLADPAGEQDRSVLEQIWSRPTVEINGVWGGYTDDGFKTVIPAQASAKISFRLVAGQDPDKIRSAFRQFVQDRLPPDCEAAFHPHGGSPATLIPTDSGPTALARAELTTEFDRDAVMVGGGGSIPIVGSFKRHLGMDSLLVGFGLDDDAIHSPNEKYELSSFDKGARFWARFLAAGGGAARSV